MNPKFNSLDEIEKKNPFKVPENYFSQFNEEIMNRLPEKEVKKAPSVSLWSKVKPWVYIAAAIIGVYLIVQVAVGTGSEVQNAQTASVEKSDVEVMQPDRYWSNVSVSEDEFYQYLEDQLIADGYYNYLYDELYHTTKNL